MTLLPFLGVLAVTAPPPADSDTVVRTTGPGGSLVLVEPTPDLPIVHVVLAARRGAASDPKGREGQSELATELARRGAAGKTRLEIDAAIDGLGGSLDASVDLDATYLHGHVLAKNLPAYLDILADIVLRPDFREDEHQRTVDELVAQLDELRTDDTALCARFWSRRLYGDHPYGRPPSGTKASLKGISAKDAAAHFRSVFQAKNVIVAAAGGVDPAAFAALVNARFAALPAGGAAPKPPAPPAKAPKGWRIELVDKPDRQQAQIMWGHASIPAGHPDHLPLTLALTAFGGGAMKATLMDEVRSKRGLAYGAYMGLAAQRGPASLRGFTSTGIDRAVTTLKLVLRLYRQLGKNGLPEERFRFFQGYLAAGHGPATDAPGSRLLARVRAEVNGLPPDWVDSYPDRVRAVTLDQVNRAIRTHLTPDNLAITIVATAAELVPLLEQAKIDRGAIDIVPYDSY